MVAVPGVFEQDIGGDIAGVGSAHGGVDILVPVVVDVAEGDGVPLLPVAETSGDRNLLEECPAGVAEHAVGDRGGQAGVSGADVEVQVAVVIQVSKITAHGVHDLVDASPAGHILKGAVAVVAV